MNNYKNLDLHEYFCYNHNASETPPPTTTHLEAKANAAKSMIASSSEQVTLSNVNESMLHMLPEIPPPTVSTATLDLIKHLQLYLELKRLLPVDTDNSSSIATTARRRKHLLASKAVGGQQQRSLALKSSDQDDKEANIFIDDDDDDDDDDSDSGEIRLKEMDRDAG